MPLDAFHVRAPRFAVAIATGPCWSCRATTDVACLVVGAEHLESDDGEDWAVAGEPSVLRNVLSVDSAALALIQRCAPWLSMRPSRTAGETYLGNGCTHCDALQGDHYLNSEPGGPFWPETSEARASIAMTWFDLPLEAACGGKSMGVMWMD